MEDHLRYRKSLLWQVHMALHDVAQGLGICYYFFALCGGAVAGGEGIAASEVAKGSRAR